VGASLLRETEGELGALLWRTLRTVCAWAVTPPADRHALFAPGARDQRMADLLAAAPAAALERPLQVLAEVLTDPARVSADRVGIACLTVTAWARGAGKPATALEFARAVALARQVHDWDSYVRAHAGLGKLAWGRGAYPVARKAHLRALRAAERHRVGYLRAMVLHELFVVEVDCGNAVLAERYAEDAAEAYGRGHAMLRVLAFDVAGFWMNQGRYAEALPVFLQILPTLDPEVQVLGWGDVARAAGGTGDAELFDRAHRCVAAAAPQLPRRVDALRETAHGALHLGRLDLAEELAGEVVRLARGRGDHKSVFVAEALLGEVQARRRGVPAPAEAAPREVPSALSCSLLEALAAAPA
jgi:tetratricopeptide (TPR) repeat protein